MLKTTVQIPMITMSSVVPTATAIRNATIVASALPMYGMKPRKNDRIASGAANGSPSTTMIRNWVRAPNSDRTPVLIM